jgi:hypothetical protein
MLVTMSFLSKVMDLFQWGRSTAPHQAHSATSRDAAVSILPEVKTLRGKVLKALYYRGEEGMTDEELQLALAMNPSTERPRRVELCERLLVFESNETRRTKSGRSARVWVIGFQGIQAVQDGCNV